MKAPPLKKIETCKYCLDYKGDPKPIFQEDMKYARRMEDGSYKCRLCIIGDLLRIKEEKSLRKSKDCMVDKMKDKGLIVIEESNRDLTLPGMLLSPKRLIAYVYPLLP